jgi:hypothetical protein
MWHWLVRSCDSDFYVLMLIHCNDCYECDIVFKYCHCKLYVTQVMVNVIVQVDIWKVSSVSSQQMLNSIFAFIIRNWSTLWFLKKNSEEVWRFKIKIPVTAVKTNFTFHSLYDKEVPLLSGNVTSKSHLMKLVWVCILLMNLLLYGAFRK